MDYSKPSRQRPDRIATEKQYFAASVKCSGQLPNFRTSSIYAPTTQDADTGTLEIPLVQPGSDGAIYQVVFQFLVRSPTGGLTVPSGMICHRVAETITAQSDEATVASVPV